MSLSWLLRRREWFWAPLLMTVVAFWVFRSIGTGKWLGREAVEGFWPNLAYVAESFRRGEWPTWNPYDHGGYAFAADPQVGLYYPLTWLFALTGLRGVTPAYVVQVMIVVHLAIAGTLLHAYLRTRRLPAAAAAAGGVLLMTSMPWIIHDPSAVCWPLAWAPLVWIASDRLIERAGEPGWGWWRRGAALGGALGLAASAGSPAGFLYVVVASLLYGAWRLVVRLVEAGEDGGAREAARWAGRVAAALGVATAVSFALTLVIVVPAYGVMDDSLSWEAVRHFMGLGGMPGALSPALPAVSTLVGMASPAVGLVNLYLGALTLVLVIVGLLTRWKADRGAPWVFFAVAAVAVVLSFGRETPVLGWLVDHVPGFGLFREPERWTTVAALALAVVAAYGVAGLIDEEAWLRKRAAVVLGVGVVALAGTIGAWQVRAVMEYVALGLGAALLAGAAFVPPRFRATLVAAAIAMVVLDVGAFSGPLAKLKDVPVDDVEDRRFVADLGDVTREWRVWDEFLMEQRAGSRLRIRELRGNPMGDPLDDVRFAQLRERVLRDPQILGAYNVRWVFHGPHHALARTKNRIPQSPMNIRPEAFRKIDARRFEVVAPAPLVAWYGAVQQIEHRSALDAVAMQESAPGTRRLAVVEPEDVAEGARAAVARLAAAELARAAPAPVAGELRIYEPSRVVVGVEAPAEGVVVLNEAFARGWKVRVDGVAATPLRVNYLLRGVVVPAGAHVVEWSYEPRDYLAWLSLWGAGVAFVAAAGVGGLRAKQRDEGGEGEEDDE